MIARFFTTFISLFTEAPFEALVAVIAGWCVAFLLAVFVVRDGKTSALTATVATFAAVIGLATMVSLFWAALNPVNFGFGG